MAKVYVSSTIADLTDERRWVMEWLVSARHQPIHSYVADSNTVRESCLSDVDECDLYVVILGHRYGSQLKDSNSNSLSITELEFRRAEDSGIPRIALLRTSIPNVELSDVGDREKYPLIERFRDYVQSRARCAQFSDCATLLHQLSAGVQHELEKLGTPSKQARFDRWLAAQVRAAERHFAEHMAASALRSGGSEDLYLDRVVVGRPLGKRELTEPPQPGERSSTQVLEDLIRCAQSPLLIVGEGGGGKTTSLLYSAARMATAAIADGASPVPVYVNLARLTALKELPELQQLVADSMPTIGNWDDVSTMGILARRRLAFLFDGFNEIPEQLQSVCAKLLSRFVDKYGGEHLCILASRFVPHLDQLAQLPSPFQAFEILGLTPDQVEDFLSRLGLASLYARMPSQLRDLAGNPFMLLAIAGTMAGKPDDALPRNRGRLYQGFVRAWSERESGKARATRYSNERVKEPLLAYLAIRMTSARRTALTLNDDVEAEVEDRLSDIAERVKRRGGMPGDWTVDECLAEILGDGLLKRVNDQLHFMHQSVQEYFTALYLLATSPRALADFTPKLLWDLVPTYMLPELPEHRFVAPLLMAVGELEDGSEIVKALADRNPLLAATAISSANRVDPVLVQALGEQWLALLRHEDLRYRLVGCACLAAASLKSPRVVREMVAFALTDDFTNSYFGGLALEKLAAPEAVVPELVSQILDLPQDEFQYGRSVLRRMTSCGLRELFMRWREAKPESPARRRLETLLGDADETTLTAELERIRATASDSAVAGDAARVLAERALWHGVRGLASGDSIREIFAKARERYEEQVREASVAMANVSDQELADSVRSQSPFQREAAALAAAERSAPIGDAIADALLRFDGSSGRDELIAALVSVWGPDASVSALVDRAVREPVTCLGQLDASLAQELRRGELDPSIRAEIERFGITCDTMRIEADLEEAGGSWWLLVSDWPLNRRYEIRASPSSLDLYDHNVATRAYTALAHIPGDAALNALAQGFDHLDGGVVEAVVEGLAKRADERLCQKLLAHLRSTKSREFVDAALRVLTHLRCPQALSLLDDFLEMTDELSSGWGAGRSRNWRREAIYAVLSALDADGEVQRTIDATLVSDVAPRRVAAIELLLRWIGDERLEPARLQTWRTPARMEQLVRAALTDTTPSVRSLAAESLKHLDAEIVGPYLAEALAADDVDRQVAGAEAIVTIGAEEEHERVAEMMLRIARTDGAPELRRRAANVLSRLPDGLKPVHRPIQDAIERDDADGALQRIDETLEILPDDVDLVWWRGLVLARLGRFTEAVESLQRAFRLAPTLSVIPEYLARTLLELQDYARAVEAARDATRIGPADPDAHSILAWSAYKAGSTQEARDAATRAIDLDPVHADAVWLLMLSHLRLGDVEAARAALAHGATMRRVLSAGLRTPLLDLAGELSGIDASAPEIAAFVNEARRELAESPTQLEAHASIRDD